MDLTASPAALGGMMMCVALASWVLGRWQGGTMTLDNFAPADPDEADAAPRAAAAFDPAVTSQHPASQERHEELSGAASLGELHAEISAYRRAEQVLVRFDGEQLAQLNEQRDRRSRCRYLGVMGEPTCAISDSLREACSCHPGTGCGRVPVPPLAGIAVQPSPFASGFTRV